MAAAASLSHGQETLWAEETSSHGPSFLERVFVSAHSLLLLTKVAKNTLFEDCKKSPVGWPGQVAH